MKALYLWLIGLVAYPSILTLGVVSSCGNDIDGICGEYNGWQSVAVQHGDMYGGAEYIFGIQLGTYLIIGTPIVFVSNYIYKRSKGKKHAENKAQSV